MHSLNQKENELLIKLNTEELNTTQVRLIRSVNALLAQALTADEEAEYFEISADLLKKTAELIRHSSFALANKGITYGEQAVEFAVDSLNESIDQQRSTNFDC